MCASMMNALRLCAELQEHQLPARVLTPFPLQSLPTTFDERATEKDLQEHRIVIVGGGIGLPYVTTDTASVLTALRTRCDIVLKGSNVDGIFEADPAIKPDARLLSHLTHEDVRLQGLTPMDGAALALAETHRMPLRIFNLAHRDALVQVLEGKPPFSHVEQRKSHV
jgi:uridylate kinase